MAGEFRQVLSAISSDPTIFRDVSGSDLRDFKEEERELNGTSIHGYQKPPRADLIKLSAMLVFMISSLVAILTPGEVVSRLPSLSAAEFDKIFYCARTAVRFPRILTMTYLSVGSGAVLALAVGAYFASRKKQNNLVSVGAKDVVVGEVEAEIPYENTAVKFPLNLVEASSSESWKPVSGLEVNLVLEYCPLKSSFPAKKHNMEHWSVTRDGSMLKTERRARRKSMSTITHDYEVMHDVSVGSSPSSYEKASAKRGEEATTLRRSSRLRNQALSMPSGGRMLISSRG